MPIESQADRLKKSVRNEYIKDFAQDVADELVEKGLINEGLLEAADDDTESTQTDQSTESTNENLENGEAQEPTVEEGAEPNQPQENQIGESEPHPEWMATDPPQTVPDGVPLNQQGQRPSEAAAATIDFDKLRQQLDPETYAAVEARFKGLYRQVKATDRMLSTLEQDNILFRQQEAERQQNDWYTNKQIELKEAIDNFDSEKQAQIHAEIARGPQPQEQAPDVNPRDLAIVESWETETNQQGDLVRPWALPQHPLHEFMREQTQAILAHPNMKGASVDQVLAEVDLIMQNITAEAQPVQQQAAEAVRRPKTPPQVLTGDANLRTRREGNKLSLTDDQKRVARRIFKTGNPKMTNEEAEKKYLGSLRNLQKTGQA